MQLVLPFKQLSLAQTQWHLGYAPAVAGIGAAVHRFDYGGLGII